MRGVPRVIRFGSRKMTAAAQRLLQQFDEFPQPDRQEVAREILRRTMNADASSLSDDQLVHQADELFHALDEEEAADVPRR